MKLKNSQIVKGMLAMRAIPTLKKSPKGSYAIAKTLRVLSDALEPYDETKRTIFKQTFGEEVKVDETHPKFSEWARVIKTLDDTEVEIAVHQCSREDLNLADKTNADGNDINHAHLADILWMFTD